MTNSWPKIIDKFLTFHDNVQPKTIDIDPIKHKNHHTFEQKEPKSLWLYHFICLSSVFIGRYIPTYLYKDTAKDTLRWKDKIYMEIKFCQFYADILMIQIIICYLSGTKTNLAQAGALVDLGNNVILPPMKVGHCHQHLWGWICNASLLL